MISRVADHCFWLGRYLERAESTARVLQVTRNLELDAALRGASCWRPVVVVAGEEEGFTRRHGASFDDGELVQRHLTWEEETPSCILRSVAAARDNARSIRDVVSLEVWEAVNELHLWLRGPEGAARWSDDRHGFYREVRRAVQLVVGLMQGTMLHDDPYDFVVLGLMLERAGQTARTLDVNHLALTAPAEGGDVEMAVFLALLRACSGFEPFMKRHRGLVTPAAIAAFLVLDPDFPRSIRFALRVAARRLERLRPAPPPGADAASSVVAIGALERRMEVQEPAALARGEALHGLLTLVVNGTAEVCTRLSRDLAGAGTEPAAAAQAQ